MRPPIADPFAPPAESLEETRLFRHSFWRVYFGTVLILLLVLVPLMFLFFWLTIPQIFDATGRGYLLFSVGLTVFINPLTAAFGVKMRPVKVTPSGVYGPPIIGFVEWERMKSARTFWMGYRCARVPLRDNLFALWIPLALSDFAAFARTLDEWAPAGNPLREWAQKQATKT